MQWSLETRRYIRWLEYRIAWLGHWYRCTSVPEIDESDKAMTDYCARAGRIVRRVIIFSPPRSAGDERIRFSS